MSSVRFRLFYFLRFIRIGPPIAEKTCIKLPEREPPADERIDEAFLFEDYIEDVLGAACYDADGALLAVSGATANSDLMWEMGVNSFAEGKGYGKATLAALTNDIIRLGKVPFYGTALSHLASQNLALRAGIVPVFAELTTSRLA